MEFFSFFLPSPPFFSTIFVLFHFFVFGFIIPLQQCHPSRHAPPHLYQCRTVPSSRSSTCWCLFHGVAQPSAISFFQDRSVHFCTPIIQHATSLPSLASQLSTNGLRSSTRRFRFLHTPPRIGASPPPSKLDMLFSTAPVLTRSNPPPSSASPLLTAN